MKIRVESQEHCFTIPVPTGLVFSDVVVWIAQFTGMKYAGDAMKDISPQAMRRLFAEFRRIKKRYGSWELVDVCSADGQRVRITL